MRRRQGSSDTRLKIKNLCMQFDYFFQELNIGSSLRKGMISLVVQPIATMIMITRYTISNSIFFHSPAIEYPLRSNRLHLKLWSKDGFQEGSD